MPPLSEGVSASTRAFDQPLVKLGRARRLTSDMLVTFGVANRSESVTPSYSAIFSREPIEGETRLFSTWDRKLADKPSCCASVRTDRPAFLRRRRSRGPIPCWAVDRFFVDGALRIVWIRQSRGRAAHLVRRPAPAMERLIIQRRAGLGAVDPIAGSPERFPPMHTSNDCTKRGRTV